MEFFTGRISFIVLILFFVALLLQLIYIWVVFGKTAFFKKRTPSNNAKEPVSVIVCSRDSLHYLEELLPALFKQDYPDFEVVVVNNCSSDGTQQYLEDLERNEPRVKIVQLHQQLNFFKGKKFPLSMGIKSASHDLLVFTDPDCIPDNTGWLSSVVNSYNEKTQIAIGYCCRKPKSGLSDKLVRYMELVDGVNYMSFALLGRPYAASGKCLSYRKSLFYKAKGFTSRYTTSAGDDSLFVNDNAHKGNTSVVIDPDNAISAQPISSFGRWFLLKAYRCSVIPHYDFVTKILLSFYPLTQMLFYATFVALFCLKPAFEIASLPVIYPIVLALLFLIRFVSQSVTLHLSAKKLKEVGLTPWIVLGDVVHLIVNPIVVFLGIVGKGAKWGD